VARTDVGGTGRLARPANRPADGGLAIGTARAERKGRTVTVTLAGTVVPAATGKISATVRDLRGARASTKIRKGRWKLTLRVRLSRTARPPSRLRLTIAYAGDRSHRAKTMTRRLQISVAPTQGV
jgi:hypothetical protein